jgi:hypothetical protein
MTPRSADVGVPHAHSGNRSNQESNCSRSVMASLKPCYVSGAFVLFEQGNNGQFIAEYACRKSPFMAIYSS